MRKIAAFAALTLFAACAAPAQDQPIPTDVAPYIAVARAPASAEMEALARGRLEIVDGCVRLMSADRDPGNLVVWPAGTTVDATTGAVRISNPRAEAASIGDRIQMGGGQVQALQADALVEPVPAQCHGPYWIAGSTWSAVND